MISEAQAVQVIAYLVDCGAITARSDGQALVWADYLNHAGQSVQEVRQADLEAATRNLVTTWQNAREYASRISPEALAGEIRKIQNARLNAVENANPQHSRINPPDDPQAYVTWEKTRRFLIAVKGLPVEIAEREALKQARQTLKLDAPTIPNTPPEQNYAGNNGLKPLNPTPARVSSFQPTRQEATTHQTS
ncbi:hypothetical protein [uncultured Varibaculum sp.]|uniref:hypothetical protein n=1 Tax=uncultured Varibaculum sp. TaxID=413896 RepID=UPI00204C341A|nr:hypothetical protein [uncultured Varibaculum sp.]DAM52618.1 MAG TPA: hypothetical protein [Caudoviricetes sp.]